MIVVWYTSIVVQGGVTYHPLVLQNHLVQILCIFITRTSWIFRWHYDALARHVYYDVVVPNSDPVTPGSPVDSFSVRVSHLCHPV